MLTTLRTGLSVIAVAACLFGLWGILSNLSLHLLPDHGKISWNYFGLFERWDPSAPSDKDRALPCPPWWVISLQSPCPYLDPWLVGPVGYGFYALCLTWGLGTLIMLRSHLRSIAGRAFWPVALFCAWWLSGLVGIMALIWFFVSIAQEAARAGLWP